MEKKQHSNCLSEESDCLSEDKRLYFTLYLLRHCLAEIMGGLDSGQMSHNQAFVEASSLLRLAMEVMSGNDRPESVLRLRPEVRLSQP